MSMIPVSPHYPYKMSLYELYSIIQGTRSANNCVHATICFCMFPRVFMVNVLIAKTIKEVCTVY